MLAVEKARHGKRDEPFGRRRRRGERVIFAPPSGATRRIFLRAKNFGRTRFAQGGCGRRRKEFSGRDSIARNGMEKNWRGFVAHGAG